ncbi:MAG: MMPL family transporter [Myxococcota bacterium]|nr:MMPL family transporter [Myxococcota bacterium]
MNGLIERLSNLQIRRPWVPILVMAALTLVFAFFASRLELQTRYDTLLPDNQPSVLELHRVEARTASAQTVLILLEGPDRHVLRSMGDALAPRLLSLGPAIVSSVDDGTQQTRAFLSPRAGLFLDQKDLERLRDDVFARWDYEVAKESGQLLDDTGPPVTAEDIERRIRKKVRGSGGEDHTDGYYENKSGTALVVMLHSPIPGGDLEKVAPALERIQATVGDVKASRPEFGAVRVGYAGDMPTGFIEYDRIRNDLLSVGAKGIALVLAVVLLYFMHLRALLVMGLTIGVGLVWTLGLAQLVIGHLNVATGFLVSIIAGNGINVGILYQSRYFEERRRGAAVADALRTAVRTTWQPTVIAALASAASYVSLLATDFRAFRQFGFIAATGMLACWLVKTVMVPPMLILLERRRPLDAARDRGVLGAIRRFGMGYGRLFAWVVPKAPSLLASIGVILVVVGVVAGVRYVRSDPMEYDLRATENDPHQNGELHRVWDAVFDILGGGREGMVVLTDTPEEARQLEKKLRADWDAAPESAKPFAEIHSLWNMVPDGQEAKIPILLEVGERLERARSRGFIGDDEWRKVRDLIPPEQLRPYGLAELPEAIARPFEEKDGTRGRLVVIEPEPSNSSDLRYLVRYSDSFRETRLPSGKIVRGSGRAVIFADILTAVVHDIRKAVALSLGLTLLTVLITFRHGGRHALTVLFALLVGVAGQAVFLYVGHVKLNYLNFVALPITFGIGVDYAINVVQRYRADGSHDILAALRTTGGAVVLCSLTTTVGYLALLGSHNRGIRSLGLIAVVGEVSCLLAAVTVLPAVWFLIDRRRDRLRARG